MSICVISGEALRTAAGRQLPGPRQPMVPGLQLNTQHARRHARLAARHQHRRLALDRRRLRQRRARSARAAVWQRRDPVRSTSTPSTSQRIEVLRGPQGTLYGASSLGGVIKYVANDPSTDGLRGPPSRDHVEDVEGGDAGLCRDGRAEHPVGETFAVRASGFYRSDGGYIDSIGNNPIPTLQDPTVNIVDGTRVEKDLNGLEIYGGRMSALFEPSDSFSLNLTALLPGASTATTQTRSRSTRTTLRAAVRRARGLALSPGVRRTSSTRSTAQRSTGTSGRHPAVRDQLRRVRGKLPAATSLLDASALGSGRRSWQLLAFSTPGTTDTLLSGILQQVDRVPISSPRSSASCRPRTSASSGCSARTTRTRTPASIRRLCWRSMPAPNDDCAPDIPHPGRWSASRSTYEESALLRECDLAHHAEVRSVLRRPLERQRPGCRAGSSSCRSCFQHGVIEQSSTTLNSSESPFTWSVSPRYEFTDTTSDVRARRDRLPAGRARTSWRRVRRPARRRPTTRTS